MEKFLFFNIIVSALNIFIIVYAYSLNFFSKKWRKKVNQDTLYILSTNAGEVTTYRRSWRENY